MGLNGFEAVQGIHFDVCYKVLSTCTKVCQQGMATQAVRTARRHNTAGKFLYTYLLLKSGLLEVYAACTYHCEKHIPLYKDLFETHCKGKRPL